MSYVRHMRVLVGLSAMVAAVFVISGCGGGADSAEAMRAFLNAHSVADARAAVARLADTDPNDAVRLAFCTETSSYLQTGEGPTSSDWATALLAKFHVPPFALREKLDQFGGSLTLAQSGYPSTAYAYARACPLHAER